ncbi:GNAT family N-acetyltransferase [Flavobacterium aestivum]|uniref:GNAT family N-acetyltransferase n=1 Tax=Flavobacterium aestivum TaxID=3003257 RepID=UPI0022869A91|nr:GNAT family N-acetyltransferase [Flavobacterium aestivum]
MINTIITHPENKAVTDIVFVKTIPGLGVFELRPIDLDTDIPLLHNWVNRDYAVYWGMNGFSLQEVYDSYSKILEKTDVYMGIFNDEVSFLLECYNPEEDTIGEYYQVKKGDKGMHILVAPFEKSISNFTWSIFTVILDFIFCDANNQRVIVEPDARNHKIHLLNKKAGFVFQKIVELPHKKAHLEFCTRKDYYKALQSI